MPIRFEIETTFDLRERGVIVAIGRLSGEISGPTTLRDEETSGTVRVLGIEQLVSRKNPDLVPVLIDPKSPTTPRSGMTLVDG